MHGGGGGRRGGGRPLSQPRKPGLSESGKEGTSNPGSNLSGHTRQRGVGNFSLSQDHGHTGHLSWGQLAFALTLFNFFYC